MNQKAFDKWPNRWSCQCNWGSPTPQLFPAFSQLQLGVLMIWTKKINIVLCDINPCVPSAGTGSDASCMRCQNKHTGLENKLNVMLSDVLEKRDRKNVSISFEAWLDWFTTNPTRRCQTTTISKSAFNKYTNLNLNRWKPCAFIALHLLIIILQRKQPDTQIGPHTSTKLIWNKRTLFIPAFYPLLRPPTVASWLSGVFSLRLVLPM